jgi:DNA-binding transcriptional LysR family regulator
MFDWDDLRIFIAAARTGSLTSASRLLGIDAATVGRRISRLEASFKATLFTRAATGLQLTSAGVALMDRALEAETAMLRAAQTGEGQMIGGSVRISAAEGFGTTILAPALASLREARPGLRVELAANSGFLSPSRREVDMAVTLSAPTSNRLVVEPLTDYQLALYASSSYLERRSPPSGLGDLSQHDIVGYVDDLIYAPELRYLEEIGVENRPSIASSSIRAQREIIASGGGVGVLPCFLADGLVPVLSKAVLLTRRFWMSTHADVSGSARMRTVRRWMMELVASNQNRLAPF